MIRFLLPALVALAVGVVSSTDAGLFFRRDGSPRTPVRTAVRAVAQHREARGAPVLFPRVRSAALAHGCGAADGACASGACGGDHSQYGSASDCPECDVAEAEAAGVAARRPLLNLAQRSVFNRIEADPKLRYGFADAWNAKYAEKIDPNNLQQILEIVIKYFPYVLELILQLLST